MSDRLECRWPREMVSPKTSRPALRRSVLLLSGFGITPIAADRFLMDIVRSQSRDFIDHDTSTAIFRVSGKKPMALARLDRDASFFGLHNFDGDCHFKETMVGTIGQSAEFMCSHANFASPLKRWHLLFLDVNQFSHFANSFIPLMWITNASGRCTESSAPLRLQSV